MRSRQIGGPMRVGAGTQAMNAHCNGGGVTAGTSEAGAPSSIIKIETWISSSGSGRARPGLPSTSTRAATARRSVTAQAGRKLSLHAAARNKTISPRTRITAPP